MIRVSHKFKHETDQRHVSICENAIDCAEFTKSTICGVPRETLQHVIIALANVPDMVEEQYQSYQKISELEAELKLYRDVVGKLIVRDGEVVGTLIDRDVKYIEKGLAETLKVMAKTRAKREVLDKLFERAKQMQFQEDGIGYDCVYMDDLEKLVEELKK